MLAVAGCRVELPPVAEIVTELLASVDTCIPDPDLMFSVFVDLTSPARTPFASNLK